METFSVLLAICVGNSPVTREFPAQRPVMRSFDVFLDLRLNKRLSKQLWGRWFETLSHPLWPHCNGCPCEEMNQPKLKKWTGFSEWCPGAYLAPWHLLASPRHQQPWYWLSWGRIWTTITISMRKNHINSSPPGAAYRRPWMRSALV